MKIFHPVLIFLDENHDTSARYLTNQYLDFCIRNTCQVLMCSLFYSIGIRSKTFYKHYVCKERWADTKARFFPTYPLSTMPKFSFYNSQEARWCRKCQNHYYYLVDSLDSMLNEFSFRFNKDHELYEMADFLRFAPIKMQLSVRCRMATLKHASKLQLPWKNLPPKYRRKNIIQGYREFFRSQIPSPLDAYIGTKRDVPDFLVDKMEATLV